MEEIKLNLHFYNTLCSKKTHDFLFKNHNVTSGNAAQNFFGLLAEGLKKNSNTNVFVNSVIPVNYSDQKKIFWNLPKEIEDDIHFFYIPLINLPILNNLISSFYIFFRILFKKKSSNSRDIIILDFLRFSISLPIVLICKLRKIKTLVVVTDLPGEGILQNNFKTKMRNMFIFLLSYDFYVCITKDLNKMVNKKNKPYVVIEGFANIKFENKKNLISEKYKERVLVYAGGLFEKYGINNLIKAFSLIKEPNLRLWLFGVGSFINEIKKYSKDDSRIEYKGVIPNNELINVLMKATLLINPRPSFENFTKFSFPSKNIEYMSVGTPLVTTKLPGIPEDHYPFIYLIEDESDSGIYKTLKLLLEKSNQELHHFGLVCKDFTITHKNNIFQSKKIIQMIRNNI